MPFDHDVSSTSLCFAGVPQDSSKRSFNLFHPTPRKLMRSFATDRPDVTESAYTVDAGHFQFETDLFKSDHSSIEGIKTIRNQYNTFNLKSGVTNTLDFQFVFESFVTEKVIQGSLTKKKSGIGNITLRAKQNLWGNDHGKTAMAILPFINIPTNSNLKVTGGSYSSICSYTIKRLGSWNRGRG